MVECHLHTVEAVGSKPTAPTTCQRPSSNPGGPFALVARRPLPRSSASPPRRLAASPPRRLAASRPRCLAVTRAPLPGFDAATRRETSWARRRRGRRQRVPRDGGTSRQAGCSALEGSVLTLSSAISVGFSRTLAPARPPRRGPPPASPATAPLPPERATSALRSSFHRDEPARANADPSRTPRRPHPPRSQRVPHDAPPSICDLHRAPGSHLGTRDDHRPLARACRRPPREPAVVRPREPAVVRRASFTVVRPREPAVVRHASLPSSARASFTVVRPRELAVIRRASLPSSARASLPSCAQARRRRCALRRERGRRGVAVGMALRHLGLGPPPAQIPASGTTAPGSYLGF